MAKKILTFLSLALLAVACSKGTDNATTPPATATTPAAATLVITPANATIAPGGTVIFTVSGGTTPYTYSIISNTGGSCDASGHFIAPTIEGTSTLKVADSIGNTAYATITVQIGAPSFIGGGLTVTPASQTIAPGQQVTYSVSGGTAPYNYSASGGGSFSGNVYTAPSYNTTANITITDSTGLLGYSILTVQAGGGTGQYVLVDFAMTTEGTHAAGGTGLPAGFLPAGSVADAGGSFLQGDQMFYIKSRDSASSPTIISDIQLTTGGGHVAGGLPCPDTSYSAVGTIVDCAFNFCNGNQKVCVKFQSATSATQTVKNFYVTQQGLHRAGGPNGDGTCNTGYTPVGIAADCGGGSCFGNQIFCAKY